MQDNERSIKSKVLIGQEGLNKLAHASVMILGLGGVGSSCAEALARGGIGRLVLVDYDVVQTSNINRQAIAFIDTVGQRKTTCMREMIERINPQAQVVTHDVFVLPENLPLLFEATDNQVSTAKVDFIIDCLDTVATKLALALFAQEKEIPLISSMGAGNKFDPRQLEFADIYDTRICPLCKVLRKEARARGINKLRVLYSPEKPSFKEAPADAARQERANIGTISYMPPIMGFMLASEAIRYLLGDLSKESMSNSPA